ncbi:MAG: dienelactone hydrolase [Bacteroidetes bacterium]|jgi:predicted dienelactone hydrolase|nr:dienelactone hydrolase [Bacteroidota bacterium]
MRNRLKSLSIHTLLIILLFSSFCYSQPSEKSFIYGDLLPDAPELAERGEFEVGVKTIDLVHKDQIDILNYDKDSKSLYDRQLKIEVWYPAELEKNVESLVHYEEVMGNANSDDRPLIPFTFLGRAVRDAETYTSEDSYPLIIVSHGYTGSRYLMTYLTENLASKGYVVVAIDHTESTFKDAAGFSSTLLNRSLDVLFVLDEITRLDQQETSFLQGLVDVDRTSLIGYSMGGYGVLNVAGAGYSPEASEFFGSISNGSTALQKRSVGNPDYEASIDPRIKAVVAFAPWGMTRGVWNAEGLEGLKIPSMFVAGSKDDISGYENGVRAMFEGAVNSERYLLTYQNARHNVAPNPPPKESMEPGLHIDEYLRYADSVWDMRRINNINQHFVTAFLDLYIKKNDRYASYINVERIEEGQEWPGFKPRTTVGLQLEHYQLTE